MAYVDENNLYGSALCQYLPHSEFQWVGDSGHVYIGKDSEEAGAASSSTNNGLLEWLNDESDIRSIAHGADYGYLLEVDLVYPHELHDQTADYPLAPE